MANKLTLKKIFENYSRLPDEECSFVLQNFLSEALESDTIFEWELAGKMMSHSDFGRETLTKNLNTAIKKNNQLIGGLSISGWLKKYLEKYDGTPRNPNTFFEFCSKSPEIRRLTKHDQMKLMRIFRMYDYILVEPIQDFEYPIENIFRFPMRLDSSPAEVSAQIQSAPFKPEAAARTVSEKLPLRELLRKYPAVGEQMITSGQIKLASFDRPARPSIRNWIYDYTAQLGQERHNSMQRMKYLFGGQNGKNLSSPDRDKLGIILKSFDEDTPLSFDAGRKEIILVANDPGAPENRPPVQSSAPLGPQSQPLPDRTRPFSAKKQAQGIPGRQNFASLPNSSLAKPNQESFVRPYSPPSRPETGTLTKPGLEEKKSAQPKPVQNDFVKPYQRPGEKPAVPVQPALKETPHLPTPRPQTKIQPQKLSQSPAFSAMPKAQALPSPKRREPAQNRSLINPPASNPSEMKYSNPYPEPVTHEPQFSKPAENISSISFTEGLPKKIAPPPVAPVRPQPPHALPKISFARPKRTIIEPFTRPRPEPKISGNTVDLSENK